MNLLLVALGGVGLIGCLAHVVLGERFIVGPLAPEAMATSVLGDGDIAKRYLRWFWHVGTVMIGGGASVLIAVGLGAIDHGEVAARVVAGLFVGMFAAFLIVAIPRPWLFVRVPQGLLLGVGGTIAWFAT